MGAIRKAYRIDGVDY